ncbi:hypothetical protein M422DRAFT_59978 [Sphaerobolus stellatus SS14]|uniref:Phosphoribulokinase/uridine kinase domain-containing protein n=1 Tax=Sphaerobolus stellatus (strain SS14) TaxID=990650 RepID=A0A0C9W151_SPHS4|nr:hypothetical protein M422DRAFT_59978 [Sphaerobolus stellatus SS14]
MDDLVHELSVYLLERLKERVSLPSSRLCVGISGAPGAGKPERREAVATIVPLDGWHLTRSTLETFPDPQLARDRRGAHWTFDANGYVSFMERLRKSISTEDVMAPSFSHSLKDPVEDDIVIRPHHRIVIIEGLYVFLNIEPWSTAGSLLNERWFITIDADVGKERLCKRHVETGVAANWEEALWRAENNDIPNGVFIQEHMLPPTRVIKNIDDPNLVSDT